MQRRNIPPESDLKAARLVTRLADRGEPGCWGSFLRVAADGELELIEGDEPTPADLLAEIEQMYERLAAFLVRPVNAAEAQIMGYEPKELAFPDEPSRY